jgi:hypothetical protein
VAYGLPKKKEQTLPRMKKFLTALRNENTVSIPGLILAFIAGCLSAVAFWYFIL